MRLINKPNCNKRCDCHVQADPATGVLRGYTKCRHHVRALLKEMRDEQVHYASLGAMDHPDAYITEFTECFGPLATVDGGAALEIGAGTSPYIPMLQDCGYTYTAVESSPFAAAWLRQQPAVEVIEQDWEQMHQRLPVSLILAAHCIEHMRDAPLAVQQMANVLVPGGLLYIIVPNDEDLCNPDHWWFFTEASLRATVERAGLQVKTITSRRRIERESFIYCQAVKP